VVLRSVKVLLKSYQPSSVTDKGFHENPARAELRTIIMSTIGRKALFDALGNTTRNRKDRVHSTKTILNHVCQFLSRTSDNRHKIINGLSHTIFIFHFVCW
jgi:hypothetical protein